MTVRVTEIPDQSRFLEKAARATSTQAVRDLLALLPIVGENEYTFDLGDPARDWKEGYLQWYPVGADRGNAGRIQLAGSPENPIAERTINAIEALIELMRQRELRADPRALAPQSPREAVLRYFGLPPLDALPKWPHPIRERKPVDYAREIAKRIRIRLLRETRPVEYAVVLEDDGIGQEPSRIHSTLLSLGRSDKPDKPYLIGVFGQGGSSAYAASEFSWIMSRRAHDLVDGGDHGLGWTVVKRILPVGRRDHYYAYLAAHPDGRLPRFTPSAADAIDFAHGTRLCHVSYNFGKTEPARTLYQSLNHLLFNPVLPYELYTRPDRGPDPMWGNGYRLSRLKDDMKALDKTFAPRLVEAKDGETR